MSNRTENQYQPDFISPPGETLFEILEERGMSQAELAERTGRPKKTINEIIKGKTAITPETAFQFERVLGTPASFWNKRECTYREWLAYQKEREELEKYIDWVNNFPLKEIVRLGWIKKHIDPIDQLKELLQYLGVATPVQWENMLQGVQWRQSTAFSVSPAAVSVWIRQGELLAQNIYCQPYSEKGFQNALKTIRHLTTRPLNEFANDLVDICAQNGVALVFLPELPKIRTSGATRWLSPNKALIMLSFRYKSDDHFWFTFFHEAAHILLHGKRQIFLEDGQQMNEEMQKKEEEADRFASETLIPEKELRKLIPSGDFFSHQDILDFAHELGIAPGIIVGRLQHEGYIPQKNLNGLKRKFDWKEVLEKT